MKPGDRPQHHRCSGALTDLCASACLADDPALARVDFLEVADALFADVVANHPLALPTLA